MSQVIPPPLPALKERRRGLIFLGVTLSVFLLLGVALAVYLSHMTGRENQLREECRKKGEPLSLTELAELYAQPTDEDNAAKAFLDLWKQEDGFWDDYHEGFDDPSLLAYLDAPGLQLPLEVGRLYQWFPPHIPEPERWTAMINYLAPLEERREKVLEAVAKPAGRFPFLQVDKMTIATQHISMLRLETDRLVLDTIVAVESNQVARAVQNIEAVGAIARHLAREPLAFSQAISASCHGFGIRGIQCLLARHQLTAEQLTAIARAYEWYSAEQALQVSILAERASSLSVYELSSREMNARFSRRFSYDDEKEDPQDDSSGYMVIRGALWLTGGKQADCINMLNTFRQADELLKNRTPDIQQRWEKLFDENRRSYGFPPKFFSRHLLGALTYRINHCLSAEAGKRLLAVALATEQFRLVHQRVPESLEEIRAFSPALNVEDPFTGQPLQFRRLEQGYLIYSYGQDGKDNGGKPYGTKGIPGSQGDAVFEVKR